MKRRSAATKVAYPAILGAFSLILLYVACIAPSGSWGIVAVAGLFPAAAVISVGLGAGTLCWAGVSILALLLLPDKLCTLLYVALFGLYPIVKSIIERLKRKGIQYVLKIVFFNAAFSLIYAIMSVAVMDSLPSVFHAVWFLYLAGNLIFLAYDYGFSKLIGFYIARIYRAVR